MSNFDNRPDPERIDLRRTDPHSQDISAKDAKQGRRGSQTFAVLVLSLLLGAAAITGLIMWSATTPDQASIQNNSNIRTGTIPRPAESNVQTETSPPSSSVPTQTAPSPVTPSVPPARSDNTLAPQQPATEEVQ